MQTSFFFQTKEFLSKNAIDQAKTAGMTTLSVQHDKILAQIPESGTKMTAQELSEVIFVTYIRFSSELVTFLRFCAFSATFLSLYNCMYVHMILCIGHLSIMHTIETLFFRCLYFLLNFTTL